MPFRHCLCRPKWIGEMNCWNLPQLHATIFHLSRPKRPHQIICSLPHGDCENGQKLKATLVDNIRRARTEDACAKENPSGENRSDSEAHRRCYSAKGVQPWIIARFTSSLNNGSSLRKRSPASCGAFLMVRGDVEPKRSELFGASTHLRAVSLRTEECINGLFTCESKTSREGYHDTGTHHS